jgi:hypothetical protein
MAKQRMIALTIEPRLMTAAGDKVEKKDGVATPLETEPEGCCVGAKTNETKIKAVKMQNTMMAKGRIRFHGKGMG